MTVRILGEVPVRQVLSLDEYVVVDVETTGMKADTQDIIELGAVLVKQGSITETFSSLIKLEKSSFIPYFVVQLTGITEAMLLREGRPLDEVVEQFLLLVGKRPLVAHNASFDYRFLQAAVSYCNERRLELGRDMLLLDNCVFDTLAMSRKLYKRVSHNLSELAMMLQIDSYGAHRALRDCVMAHELLQKMMEHPEWEKWFSQRVGWMKKTIRNVGKK
ncbi:MAG: 3'-5' exonuclease [bacterium]|nr:3'-5' exonuclease [bacterium]